MMKKEKLLWVIFISAMFLYGVGMALTQLSGNNLFFVSLTFLCFTVGMSSLFILIVKNSISRSASFDKVVELLINEELK